MSQCSMQISLRYPFLNLLFWVWFWILASHEVCSQSCPSIGVRHKLRPAQKCFILINKWKPWQPLHAAPQKISKRRHIIKHHTLSSQQRTSWSATAGPFWGWHIPHWLCQHQCCRSSPSLKPQLQQPPHLWGRRSPQTKFNSWYSCQTHDVHSSAKFQVDTLSLLYNRVLIWHLVLLQTLVD